MPAARVVSRAGSRHLPSTAPAMGAHSCPSWMQVACWLARLAGYVPRSLSDGTLVFEENATIWRWEGASSENEVATTGAAVGLSRGSAPAHVSTLASLTAAVLPPPGHPPPGLAPHEPCRDVSRALHRWLLAARRRIRSAATRGVGRARPRPWAALRGRERRLTGPTTVASQPMGCLTPSRPQYTPVYQGLPRPPRRV